MASRLAQGKLITNSDFIAQIAGSLLAAAAQIINEGAEHPNHANRLVYARSIIAAPLPAAAYMAPGILTNVTIEGEAGNAIGESGTPVLDGDVDFEVASIFDIYANQYAGLNNMGAVLAIGS